MSKSLAIWFEANTDEKILKAEFHVNFWKLAKSRKKKGEFFRFVDLGLKIPEAAKVKFLYIGIPDEASSNVEDYGLRPYSHGDEQLRLLDLGSVICQEPLLQAVFNENYQKRNSPNIKYSEIYGESGITEFFIFHLESSDIEVEHKNGYLIFKLDIGQAPGPSYFRIRLTGDRIRSLFSEFEEPSNARLQSAFSSIEIIDFRVNEKRNIDKRFLIAEINKGTFIFTTFHFFLMCCSKEDIFFFSHGPVDRCRTLEKEQWAPYINAEKKIFEPAEKDTHILVYQWSFKDRNDAHINAMVKTQYEQNNCKTIGWYLFILAIITVSLNLLSSVIFECFQ